MRQPAAPFSPIDTELLQPSHELTRELVGPPHVCVAGNELLGQRKHGDPRGLTVPPDAEQRAAGRLSHGPKHVGDRLDIGRRPVSQECERDMEVVRRKDAYLRTAKGSLLPGDEGCDDVAREP